jgi:hypothetical protein
MPTIPEIVEYSTGTIAVWANRRRANLTYDQKLEADLNFNSADFRTLSGALRSYVQQQAQNRNPLPTITLKEIKNKKTVGEVSRLIVERISGRQPTRNEVEAHFGGGQ